MKSYTKVTVEQLRYVLSKQKQHLDSLTDRGINYRKSMLFYLENNRTSEFDMLIQKYFDLLSDTRLTLNAIVRLENNIQLLGGTYEK